LPSMQIWCLIYRNQACQ